MESAPDAPVTELLRAWSDGDSGALDQLVPLVMNELKRVARRCMGRDAHGQTLQTTALVNEAYLKLLDVSGVRWQDRIHFLSLSARLMRRVLIEAARARIAEKRGGKALRVTFDEGLPVTQLEAEFLALDEALDGLAQNDARKAQVVELRFFGGLSVQETAEALGVSEQTIHRDWRLARAWLQRELSRVSSQST